MANLNAKFFSIFLLVLNPVFVFPEPGPCVLKMYTAAYVQAELDKLQTQSKFTKVLMLEKPKKKKPAQEEEEEGAESAGSSRSTRSSVPEPPPPTPLQRSENWISNNPDIKMPPLYARQEKYKGELACTPSLMLLSSVGLGNIFSSMAS